MKDIFRVSNLRTISFVVAILLAVPLSLKGFSGVFLWLSPFIMLNSVFSLKSLVLLNGIGIIILILIFFRKRWFCNNLCPVGWSCDKVSGLSSKIFTYRRVPDVNKWLALTSLFASLLGFPLFIFLDPLAIFNGFFVILSGGVDPVKLLIFSLFPLLLLVHLLIPGIWCKKICPLGGLQLAADDAKNLLTGLYSRIAPEPSAFNPGRRYLLMSAAGLAAGMAVPAVLKPSGETLIRPPAAADNKVFNFLCCRCGSCSRACPTDIITPVTDTSLPLSWMTPELKFKNGYCLETCNLCSRVCPTGAITLFSVEAKDKLFIAYAEIELENCLLVNNKECVRCKESCKYESIEFVTGGNILNAVPVISLKTCVGCGACAVVCPKECILIKPPIADLKLLS